MRKSNPALTLPSSVPHGALHAVSDAAVRVVDTLLRWRERARERRQLLAMTDRELRDIAITRADVWREAKKPVWWD